LQFEEEFFSRRRYALKEALVKRHVLEVVKWASRMSEDNLLAGDGKRALDVGCAYGYSSTVLDKLGYETCGVDVSAWGVKQAKENSGGNFLVCDAQSQLPFLKESFDLVTCFDVLEHLGSPLDALRNMLEVCRGLIVCTTPNRTVEKSVRRITGDLDETHVSVKSPSEWEEYIVGKLDYKLLRVETFYDVTAKAGNRIVFRSFKVPKLGLTVRMMLKK
jgi:SAM-dependent methyltransferase